jgi:hypothetical protein
MFDEYGNQNSKAVAIRMPADMIPFAKRINWWRGGLAAVGALISGYTGTVWYSTCSGAFLAAISLGPEAPLAEGITTGACIVGAVVTIAGVFLSGAAVADGWTFTGGSVTER